MRGIAYVLVLLVAQPPNLGNASIISLGATLGHLVAALIARLRRLPRDEASDLIIDGTLAGGLSGVLVYLAMYPL
jgi:hypothetical protein